jgi:hypothetical protein
MLEVLHVLFIQGRKWETDEDSWRGPPFFSIGENAVGFAVAHKGAPRISLWAKREGTELASFWSHSPTSVREL